MTPPKFPILLKHDILWIIFFCQYLNIMQLCYYSIWLLAWTIGRSCVQWIPWKYSNSYYEKQQHFNNVGILLIMREVRAFMTLRFGSKSLHSASSTALSWNEFLNFMFWYDFKFFQKLLQTIILVRRPLNCFLERSENLWKTSLTRNYRINSQKMVASESAGSILVQIRDMVGTEKAGAGGD